MSVSRKTVAIATVATAALAMAVSFTGVAAGAAAPEAPSAIVSVHANPGQVVTRTSGMTCGGFISIGAQGGGGGYGMTSCGHSSTAVAATPGGSFTSMLAPPAQGPLVCQANAQFASKGVTATCYENVD